MSVVNQASHSKFREEMSDDRAMSNEHNLRCVWGMNLDDRRIDDIDVKSKNRRIEIISIVDFSLVCGRSRFTFYFDPSIEPLCWRLLRDHKALPSMLVHE